MPLIDVPSNSQSSRASSAREPGAESATGRIEILVGCFLLLLRAALALVPNMWLWGFNTQRFLPPLLAWGLWGLWATSLHPAVGPRLTLAITHYGQSLDLIALHQLDDLVERHVLGYSVDLVGHHVANLAAAGVDVFICKPARPDQKLDPTRPLALSSSLGSAQQIALGDNPDKGPSAVNNGKSAELALQHHPDCFND